MYRVLMESGVTAPRVSKEKEAGLRHWRWATLTVVAFVGAVAVAIWNFYLRSCPPPTEVTSEQTPSLELPDKPYIVVLPFVNMSGDPKQKYFSDGLTEEIITALSKTPRLLVIARKFTFTYKEHP